MKKELIEKNWNRASHTARVTDQEIQSYLGEIESKKMMIESLTQLRTVYIAGPFDKNSNLSEHLRLECNRITKSIETHEFFIRATEDKIEELKDTRFVFASKRNILAKYLTDNGYVLEGNSWWLDTE